MNDAQVPTVDVFADVGCPFTYVGLRHLIRARERRGLSVRLVVRAWPLELVNGTHFDIGDLTAEVEALRGQVESTLFTGFNPSTFPGTSIPAFGLTHVAYERDAMTGEAVAMDLRNEIFEEGRDVSDPDVLARVAERHGLEVPSQSESEEITRAEWAAGRERGVIGSPHFLLPDGEGAFCPGLDISRSDDGSFNIEPDLGAMSGFFASVFALG